MEKFVYPEEIKNTPTAPGVYRFVDENGKILYIGKAKNLRLRLKSYLLPNLGGKTASMLSQAKYVYTVEVDSEIQALCLEASLVRKHMPPYNIELRDDKSPLYIGVTKEEFPRVLTLRQKELSNFDLKYEFGPFVDAGSVKMVLRRLRKVFPYCQHRIGKRACINYEIGLCDPCPSYIVNQAQLEEKEELKKRYMQNIKGVVGVLSGKSRLVEKQMVAQMEKLAKSLEFEKASEWRNRWKNLISVVGRKVHTDSYIKDPSFIEDIRDMESKELGKIISEFHVVKGQIERIECFDVAHLAGSSATASMVTFVSGSPEKKLYRHFHVKKGAGSDVDSLEHVLLRRVKHFEDWGEPDLMIIDGGKPQIAVAKKIIGDRFPVVGIAKRFETFVFLEDGVFSERLLPEGYAKKLVQRIRDEAHRFARRLHHSQVTKTLLKIKN